MWMRTGQRFEGSTLKRFLFLGCGLVDRFKRVCASPTTPLNHNKSEFSEYIKNQEKTALLKGPYQGYYTPLFCVNIGHIGYINPRICPKIALSMRYCLFTFCSYSMNITRSTWKCVTTLFKKKREKSFFILIIKLGRQNLSGTIFSGLTTSVSMAPGSRLSLV